MAYYRIASEEYAERLGREVGAEIDGDYAEGQERALLAAGWLVKSDGRQLAAEAKAAAEAAAAAEEAAAEVDEATPDEEEKEVE